jgi:hypothetical protein
MVLQQGGDGALGYGDWAFPALLITIIDGL